MPELLAGAFDAEDDDADPPFYLLAIRKRMGEFHPVLEGLEAVLIHQAELTCRRVSGQAIYGPQCPGHGGSLLQRRI